MANVSDVFRGLKVNKLKTGTIAAHINHLVKTDPDFKSKFKNDPVGVLQQFGLSRKESAALVFSTMKNQLGGRVGPEAADITGCCCTGSITFSCGKAFYEKMPRIDDAQGWSKVVSGR